jgi:hypothetical protein
MSLSSNESLEAEARLRVREAWCCASHPVPGQHLAVASATSSLCLCVWGGIVVRVCARLFWLCPENPGFVPLRLGWLCVQIRPLQPR